MARKRKPSDDVYNARRKAKRYVQSLQTQLSKTSSEAGRASLQAYISNLETQIAKTYRSSGSDQRKALQVLRQQTDKTTGTNARSRANFVFQQQIGLASRAQESSLGGGAEGRAKTKIFYRATQKYWQGAPNEERNKRIMAAMGVDSLSEAYDIIMSENEEALAYALGTGDIADTDESLAFQASVPDDAQGSPDYVALVNVRN